MSVELITSELCYYVLDRLDEIYEHEIANAPWLSQVDLILPE